ncbi:phosphate ABC transporter permease subunit PstC [Arachidicoccus terrestris]|uniref:phosphate ABC transporter permease subunit PstC n=1 Tax=Arachidicoccus terrestris TaxID=2875539 RepID=UPI001CC68894|nr:phosphate ABC transporter permease subunit PstC [Arachidicoccus terrestris]UAY54502.1 phosphate ABC transporter permease subunit PstC [Arachidicoccus terrestris]
MDSVIHDIGASSQVQSAVVPQTKAGTHNERLLRPGRIRKGIRRERFFKKTLSFTGLMIILIVFGILATLFYQSLPAIQSLGARFFWSSTWNPVENIFGALPFLVGTLITSFLALIISVPFSIAIAVFLGEYFPKGGFSNFIKNTIDLIAAVPSVIFGFWGFFVLVPIIRILEMKFGIMPNGVGLFSASLILAIMIIPYAASLGTTMIRMVPASLKEGAYALGATRWEVLRKVIVPYSKSGLFAGILLSLGRAIGETMAVTMLIGNANFLPKSIFSPGNTMASVIANEFTEADHPIYVSALIEMGLFLFLVTFVINLIGKKIIKRATSNNG